MSGSTESDSTAHKDVGFSPTFRNHVYWILATFHFKGLKGGCYHYFQRLLGFLTGKPATPTGYQPSFCSEQFAAAPSGNSLGELAMQSKNAKWGVRYDPSPERLFHEIMAALPIQPSDYSFIDLGAGKGWALILASEYGFKSIIGVEYSKILVEAANRNIQAQQKQNELHGNPKCMWGDAAEFQFPSEPAILYLFNPFQGEVMDRVIANIERSLSITSRDLWVIYVCPWENRKFRRSRIFNTIQWTPEFSVHRATNVCGNDR